MRGQRRIDQLGDGARRSATRRAAADAERHHEGGGRRLALARDDARRTPLCLGLERSGASATARPQVAHAQAITGAPAMSRRSPRASRSVWRWPVDRSMRGLGSSGQLGLGSTSPVSTPTIVPGLSNVVAIARAARIACRHQHRRAVCWGATARVRLVMRPTHRAQSDAASVRATSRASRPARPQSALTTTGEVWAWGLGSSGQLGQGTRRTATRRAESRSSASRIAAGSVHSGAVPRWRARALGQQRQRSALRWDHHCCNSPTGVAAPADLAVSASVIRTPWRRPRRESLDLGRRRQWSARQGTTWNRETPDAISEAAFAWRVATPAFSVTPGQYPSDPSVTLRSTRPAPHSLHAERRGPDGVRSDDRVRPHHPRGDVADAESEGVEAGMPDSAVAIGGLR